MNAAFTPEQIRWLFEQKHEAMIEPIKELAAKLYREAMPDAAQERQLKIDAELCTSRFNAILNKMFELESGSSVKN